MRWIVLAALALLAGCAAGDGRAPCPTGQRCLEAGNGTDPETLDPALSQLVVEQTILQDLLVGLFTFDDAGHAVPGMATAWRTSPDGLVWTFELRDARWSDGAPVTAEDFVTAFRRLMDPATASAYAYLFYLIDGAEAVNGGKAEPDTLGVRALGPLRLELRLNQPAPYLPRLLTHGLAFPVPTHAVRKWGDGWTRPDRYVSNGPYRLVSWALGDRVVLARNPHFWEDARTCFDRVSYYPTPDPVSAERRVKSGELDIGINFASNRIGYLRGKGGMAHHVRVAPWLGIYYLAFNAQRPEFTDLRVRLALSMALDRDFMTAKLLRAGQQPLYGFVPPGTAGHVPPRPPLWTSWPFEKRQAVARALLARAGFGPGRPLAMRLKYPNSGDRVIATAIQADWQAIGVHASLEPVEGQIFFADMRARDFDVGIANWIADFDDPLTFLGILQGSAGAQNYGDYANPAYDALLAAAGREPDERRRSHLLSRAEALMLAEVGVVPLYTNVSRNLVSPRLTGFTDNMSNWHPKRFVCASDQKSRKSDF